LRGASATEKLLAQHPEWKVQVLAVWEPILPTDWRAPSGSALGRLSDHRVRQFWDPHHEVSKDLREMTSPKSSGPEPNSGEGFYWDEAILYASHAKWESPARPLFWQGPVFRVIDGIQSAIESTIHASIPK
jgi:hypothetical protein